MLHIATLLSNYEGIQFDIVSVLEGIKEVFIGSNVTVNYAPGRADVKINVRLLSVSVMPSRLSSRQIRSSWSWDLI